MKYFILPLSLLCLTQSVFANTDDLSDRIDAVARACHLEKGIKTELGAGSEVRIGDKFGFSFDFSDKGVDRFVDHFSSENNKIHITEKQINCVENNMRALLRLEENKAQHSGVNINGTGNIVGNGNTVTNSNNTTNNNTTNNNTTHNTTTHHTTHKKHIINNNKNINNTVNGTVNNHGGNVFNNH